MTQQKKTKPTINEDVLFEESLKEFANHSYKNASINQIIINSNIPKGSFYYRYKNKYDLYISLIKQLHQEKWTFISSKTQDQTAKLDIFDLLLLQVQTGLEFGQKHPLYQQFSQRFSQEKGSDIYQKVLDDLKIDQTNPLTNMIAQAVKDNQINQSYSLEFVSRLLEGVFSNFDFIFFSDEILELEQSVDFAKQTIEVLRKGLN